MFFLCCWIYIVADLVRGGDGIRRDDPADIIPAPSLAAPHWLRLVVRISRTSFSPLNLVFVRLLCIRTRPRLMRFIPDELLLEILSYLDPLSLRQFGYTSRASFAFARHEDLWKSLFLAEHPKGQVDWRGSWRRTVLRLYNSDEARIRCENVVSDALTQPFLNSTIDLSKYQRIKDAIPRFTEMDAELFGDGWYAKPFILTDVVTKWPAFKKWTIEYLLCQFPSSDATFQIEAVEWSLPTYVEYMASNGDESPLYLFDKDFASKPTANGIRLEHDYAIPETFREDLFTLLGDFRPDHRWLIIGPERSGSSFHKVLFWRPLMIGPKCYECLECRDIRLEVVDTVSTSCHAARGLRQPRCFLNYSTDSDESEVTSPISIADWLRDFYPIASKHPSCVRGVCRAGEVMYIPSGILPASS
jgi:hypothetical protein